MAKICRIALIGDFNPNVTAHQAIPRALHLAAADLQIMVEEKWLHTSKIGDPALTLAEFGGIWCVPASPYADMEAALSAIRFAREQRRPFLGTCGGFQHAIIEYARNVRHIQAADHAETNPAGGADLVITPLSCSLVEQREELILDQGSRIRASYQQERINEEYHCNYGLNAEFEARLFDGHLKPVARDLTGAVRAVELDDHPFFVATLFQHERRALTGEVPPLARDFLAAAQSALA